MILSVYPKRPSTPQCKRRTKASKWTATTCSERIIQRNSKRGGVYIFCKEILGARIIKSLRFSECIICEVSIQNSKGYVGVVYRSPSQDSFEFESFMSSFEKVLSDTAS